MKYTSGATGHSKFSLPVILSGAKNLGLRDRACKRWRFFAPLRMTGGAALLVAAVVLTLSSALPAHASDTPPAAVQWNQKLVDTFASIPVQDGGRVKPLSTYAQFLMLRINGKRSFKTEGGAKLGPTEWLMTALFEPDTAKTWAHFLVDNSEAVTAIGAEAKSQRDRYSYEELTPYRQQLFQLAAQNAKLQEDQGQAALSPVQREVLRLANNFHEFETLIHYFDFAKAGMPPGDSRLLARIFPGDPSITPVDVLQKWPDVLQAAQALMIIQEQEDAATQEQAAVWKQEEAALMDLLSRSQESLFRAFGLALIPPQDHAKKEWLTPADLSGIVVDSPDQIDTELNHLAVLAKLGASSPGEMAFDKALRDLHELSVARATQRGEYAKVPLEISYYNANLLFYAQWLFVFGFVLVALSWFAIHSKPLRAATWVAVVLPWALLVAGITYRCIIRGRPPVSTLYETILFITASIVLVALVMEYINKQRIGIAIAAVLGAFGLFLANKYEAVEGQDTMPSLVAVLDTNFWLATHVTTVTIGYAAGLLAGAIAHVYILGRLFKFKKHDKAFYKTLTRMIYGTIAFGLVFSFVGTVLGGIWANYSWGRFWGWDPKENGALLIVLCNLAILHARMGGYIRDLGLSLAAVFTGCVVAFSWWGVNLLGVGLHSYGFTSGIWGNLLFFWGTQAILLALGAAVFLRTKFRGEEFVDERPAQSPAGYPEPVVK